MLLNIDYLILNYHGSLYSPVNGSKYDENEKENPFSLVRHEYGNKTFTDVYDVFHYDLKIGVLNSVPRASIIDEKLIQLQFENHLFYTETKARLQALCQDFVNYFDLELSGINRVDIAVDKTDNTKKYENLYIDLITGKKLIKGREKNIGAYSVTKKGTVGFNGFTIGKRSASRFLRVYDKTKALQDDKKNPKDYITDYFKAYGLENTKENPVWRFEYQLNSSFFTYLTRNGTKILFEVFENDTLLQLIQMAEKNHFEITENTGKTETNKEKTICIIDWDALRKKVHCFAETQIIKLKRIFTPSINVQKRLIKSLFRQYYLIQSNVYLIPMFRVLKEYDLITWFYDKYSFYICEFRKRELIKNTFDEFHFCTEFNKLITSNYEKKNYSSDVNFNQLQTIF